VRTVSQTSLPTGSGCGPAPEVAPQAPPDGGPNGGVAAGDGPTADRTTIGGLKGLLAHGVLGTLARGSVGALGVGMLGSGLAFGSHVLIARLLGSGVYGQYVYVINWMAVLGLAGAMGLDTAALRFIPTFRSGGRGDLERGFMRRSVQAGLAASALIALLVAGTAALWVPAPALRHAFFAGAVFLPLFTLLQLRSAHIQALKRPVTAQLFPRVLRPLGVGLAVVVTVLALGQRFSAAQLLGVEAAVMAVLGVAATSLLSRAGGGARTRPSFRTSEWLRTSVHLLLMSAGFLVLSRSDVIMIGLFLDPQSAGVYAAGARIGEFVLFTLIAVNAIAAPLIAQLYAQGRHADLQQMVGVAARAIFLTAFPVALALLVWGREILAWFGPGFPAGYPALAFIVVGHLVNALAGSVGFLMTMTGHERPAARIIAWAALANLVMNAALIPVLGIVGAAIATCLTTIGWNLAMFRFVYASLHLNPTILAAFRPARRPAP